VAEDFATTRGMGRLAAHLATEGPAAFKGAAALGLSERNDALIALGRRHAAWLSSLRTPPSVGGLHIPTETTNV
jgi:hypothetical protein